MRLLGRHEARGASLFDAMRIWFTGISAKPEITELEKWNIIFVFEHTILRLDVSVLDLIVLEVDKGVDHLFNDFECLPLLQRATLLQVFVEVTSLEIIHDEEVNVLPLPNFLKANDIRVVHFCHYLAFVQKNLIVGSICIRDALDSHIMLSGPAFGQINHTEAAFPNTSSEKVNFLDISRSWFKEHFFINFIRFWTFMLIFNLG